jgi:8-amino-7-oxononanoate synthase
MIEELKSALAERDSRGLKRSRRLLQSPQAVHIHLDNQAVVSFASNDYLGLANEPAIIESFRQGALEAGVGGGASHLITGHHQYHEDLETILADFVGLPKALYFSTGYLANLAVITALMGKDDDLFADKLNHASLNDACLLSRAKFHRYAHQDLAQLEALLKKSTAKRKLVVVDAVFSMDGDVANLPSILALCEQYDAYLYVDDAHGFGVLGECGRGTLDYFKISSSRVIYMATLGKAAGVAGAFVAADSIIIDYLIQSAKTYIYTTASPPAIAFALKTSIELMLHGDERHDHLKKVIQLFKDRLHLNTWTLMPSNTAIQPILIRDNNLVSQVTEALLRQGIFVPAIRPPTVPEGSARLRISFSSSHQEADVLTLVEALMKLESTLTQ